MRQRFELKGAWNASDVSMVSIRALNIAAIGNSLAKKAPIVDLECAGLVIMREIHALRRRDIGGMLEAAGGGLWML
ncbi:hypothetical protein VKY48_27270 [Endobacterium cereale]|nr:hypothetical protein [Endobacterium cereale]MEB2848135.1 hypothetical protein [Endobacterium cereale]